MLDSSIIPESYFVVILGPSSVDDIEEELRDQGLSTSTTVDESSSQDCSIVACAAKRGAVRLEKVMSILEVIFGGLFKHKVNLKNSHIGIYKHQGVLSPCVWIPLSNILSTDDIHKFRFFDHDSQLLFKSMAIELLGLDWIKRALVCSDVNPADHIEVRPTRIGLRDKSFTSIYSREEGWATLALGWPFSAPESPFYAAPRFNLLIRRLRNQGKGLSPVPFEKGEASSWIKPEKNRYVIGVNEGDHLEIDSQTLCSENTNERASHECATYEIALTNENSNPGLIVNNTAGDFTLRLLAKNQDNYVLQVQVVEEPVTQ